MKGFIRRVRTFPLILMVLGTACTGRTEDVYESVCDTSYVSYSKTIVPILQAHCYRCHSKEAAHVYGEGNVLEGYDVLKGYIQAGFVIGNIRHDPGFHPMPKYDLKLPRCDIAAFEKWIREGTPNN